MLPSAAFQVRLPPLHFVVGMQADPGVDEFRIEADFPPVAHLEQRPPDQQGIVQHMSERALLILRLGYDCAGFDARGDPIEPFRHRPLAKERAQVCGSPGGLQEIANHEFMAGCQEQLFLPRVVGATGLFVKKDRSHLSRSSRS